jgi:hypothetical protein
MTVSLTTGLFGRDPSVSRRLSVGAVALGVAAFGLAALAGTFSGAGPLAPRAVLMTLAMGAVALGVVAALASAFRNGGLLVSWLLVCGPVAGLVVYGAHAGGFRDTGPVDALLAGGLWGVGAAVTLGTLLFVLGVAGRWVDEGRLTV